jgi:cytochrome c-type biogenesis protein CcmH/NrfF
MTDISSLPVRVFAIGIAVIMMAGASAPSPSPDQQERIRRLELALLAPCCYSEPVLRHNSEVSVKMRAEIADWVVQGRSDREILDTYKQQYGLRVLAEPEGGRWWWEHVVPLIALGVGFLIVVLVLRHWTRNRSSTAVPEVLPPLPDDLDD